MKDNDFLVMDSCTIISLSMNCLASVLKKFAQQGRNFCVPPSVYNEIYSQPLKSKQFLWPALKVKKYFNEGFLTILKSPTLEKDTQEILFWSNKIYSTSKGNIHLIHRGEAEVMALAKYYNQSTIATDEYITRLLIEEPFTLKKHFEKKLHMPVEVNEKSLAEFQKLVNGINIVRSAEIIALAFEQGFFDEDIRVISKSINNAKAELIRGMLWALKFSGCSMFVSEIEDYVTLLTKE